MRDLIEEFVLLGVAMIIAGLLVATFLFNFYMPEMNEYVDIALPEQTAVRADYTALSNTVARPAPTITASNISVPSGSLLDFDVYITNGTIKAVNADGIDISQYIRVVLLDDAASTYYDEDSKVFNNAPVGEYRFLVSVYDVSGSVSYGGERTKIIKVVVS